jgi:GNAT superfamily N-acetyltransferase
VPVGYAFARLGGVEEGVGHLVSLGLRALPSWRPGGLDAALLAHVEAIGLALVEGVAGDDGLPRVHETVVEDTEADTLALLARRGYEPVRRSHRMTRDLDEPIRDHPLPVGFEIRPALMEHGMQILRAYDEAMRDSREYGGMSDGALATMLDRQQAMVPSWVVAWHGDEVVGGVLGRVDEAENEAKGRRRGYVERIFTRRPWRTRGIAGALICEALRNFRARGMREGALAFDADNPSGAGSLYASLGFRRHNGFATYRHTVMPTDRSRTAVACRPGSSPGSRPCCRPTTSPSWAPRWTCAGAADRPARANAPRTSRCRAIAVANLALSILHGNGLDDGAVDPELEVRDPDTGRSGGRGVSWARQLRVGRADPPLERATGQRRV